MKSFSQVSIKDLETMFGVNIVKGSFVPSNSSVLVPFWLQYIIDTRRASLATMRSEKSISEALIAPILMAVEDNHKDKITLFSGENLRADISKGLNGEIDFLMVHQHEALELTEPVINITEAKLNQALEKSLAQAGSQMIGARVFNANNGVPIQTIHGAVTNGKNWIFMKLDGDTLFIDTEKDYSTANLPEILGIFQVIIDSYN